MRLNSLIMALFAFVTVVTAVNLSGVFDNPFPTPLDNISVSSARITELTTVNEVTGISDVDASLGIFDFLLTSIRILSDIVSNLFHAGDLLKAYGVPDYMATMIMSMVILAIVLGFIKIITNRNDKGIE